MSATKHIWVFIKKLHFFVGILDLHTLDGQSALFKINKSNMKLRWYLLLLMWGLTMLISFILKSHS